MFGSVDRNRFVVGVQRARASDIEAWWRIRVRGAVDFRGEGRLLSFKVTTGALPLLPLIATIPLLGLAIVLAAAGFFPLGPSVAPLILLGIIWGNHLDDGPWGRKG